MNRKYLIFHSCCYSQSKIGLKFPALLLLKNFWQHMGSASAVLHVFKPFLHLSCGKMCDVFLTGRTLRQCISAIGIFFFLLRGDNL